MTTSRSTSALSRPQPNTRVPGATLAYFKTRNRMKAFSLIQREFRNSGITQADLAVRMGKGADRISRILGSPGNLTLDTLSEVLFAISGGEPDYDVRYPLDAPPRNQRKPEWLDSPPPRPASPIPQSSAPLRPVPEIVLGRPGATHGLKQIGTLQASSYA